MARFFFDLSECGRLTRDDEGQTFANLVEAREWAVAEARALMADEVRQGRLCVGCRIDILDADRRLVDKVVFRDVIVVSGL